MSKTSVKTHLHSHKAPASRSVRAAKYTLVPAALLAFGVLSGDQIASALTYQGSAGVGFTIHDSINISISGDIIIPELFPGNSTDSSEVSVTVNTNGPSGHTLSAQMATSSADLTVSGTSNKLSGLGTDASVSTLAEGTWGYKFSQDGSNWGNYGGLPTVGDNWATLRDTDAAGSTTTKFKIGAHATANQPAGNYTNTITFYAIAKSVEPAPSLCGDTPTMQNIASLKSTLFAVEEDQVQLCDERDGEIYYASKLADGEIWMTQNLDFNIVAGTTYTPNDTDIPSNWTPTLSTYTDNSWGESFTTPESYDPGDYYISGGSGSGFSPVSELDLDIEWEREQLHYHVGNYYNWSAAVAMENSEEYSSDGQDVDQSICPAGWTLPKSGYDDVGYGEKSFYNLILQYGWNSASQEMLRPAIWDALYFPLSGLWGGGSYGVGSYGYYWSSVVIDFDISYFLNFDSNGFVGPQHYGDRDDGFSVRCVAR